MLAVKRKAETVMAAFKREQGLVVNHRYAQALAVLEAVLGRGDLTPRQRFDAMCRKADCLERLFRLREALELLRAVSKEFPQEALGHSLLGEYLYRVKGDCREALGAVGRSLKLNPRDAESLWWKGHILQCGLARFKRARRCFLAALAAEPEYGPAAESLAILAEVEGKWIEAIDWRKAHYRWTRRADSLVALAELYLRVGNASAARKYARQAARKEKGSAYVWLALAKAHAAEGRLRFALQALKRFRRLVDSSGPFVSASDLAFLEPVIGLSEARGLLRRLPLA